MNNKEETAKILATINGDAEESSEVGQSAELSSDDAPIRRLSLDELAEQHRAEEQRKQHHAQFRAQYAMERSYAESGIDANEAKFAARPLSEDETERLCGVRSTSYAITYFDTYGAPTKYMRLRLTGPDVEQRYWQPNGSEPRIYLPRIVTDSFKWASYLKKPGAHITIVEGERKAHRLTLAGFPAVGLQGVWSWSHKSNGEVILKDLELLLTQSNDPVVEVCFDSDYRTKPQVQIAIFRFLKALTDIGIKPHYVVLPGPEKGVDDYLLARTVQEYRELPREQFILTRPLWQMNEAMAIDQSNAGILNLKTLRYFESEAHARRVAPRGKYFEPVTTPNGKIKYREKNIFTYWLNDWPHCRNVPGVAYVPGAPRELHGADCELPNGLRYAEGTINLYQHDYCRGAKGSVQPFYKLLRNIIPNPTMRQWVVQWLAYMIQHPCVKMQSALVLYGDAGGGKTTFGHVLMRRLFGPSNTVKVSPKMIEEKFNGYLRSVQIVLAEEVSGDSPKQDYSQFKDEIAGDEINVREMYQPMITVRNFSHVIFASNKPKPVYLDSGDRRYALSKSADKLSREDLGHIRKWIDEGGAEAVRFFLEHLDLNNFKPFADPPLTEDKLEVTRLNQSSVVDWALELVSDPDRPRFAPWGLLFANAKQATDGEARWSTAKEALARAGCRMVGRVALGHAGSAGTPTLWWLAKGDAPADAVGARGEYDEAVALGYFTGPTKY